jgi:hypothetical protein
MRTVFALLLLTLLGGLPVAVEAAPKPPAEVEVAPFVDQFTRAVVCVDLARADVDRLMDLAVPIIPQAAFYETPLRAEFGQVWATFRAARIERLYLVIGLADLPRQPWFVVAPCPDNLDAEALASQLPADLPKRLGGSRRPAVERLDRPNAGSILFIGHEDALTRLKRDPPKPRPELAAAFAATGDAPVRAVFLPSDDDRRVVEELVPTLPDSLGGGPSTVLTRGLGWAAMRVDLDPHTSVRLVIESAGPEAAETLRRQWAKILSQWDRAEPLLPEIAGRRLTLTLDQPGGGLEALQSLISPPLTREAIDLTVRERLHAIGLAIHNWHDGHRTLPTQASYDANGRPLLSWRVHVLPHLGRDTRKLYEQFRLDEPWDSDHNRALIPKMPDVYAMPGSKTARQGRTCYLRPVGESTSCPGSQQIDLSHVRDGTSNTLFLVEVDDEHAVIWTKPEDLDFDPENPAKGLGGHIEGTARSILCDGAPLLLKDLITDPNRAADLNALFTRNGGEAVRPVD